jgi:hypothetical protein
MGCFGDIARGFRLVHDNWPLILIQAVMIVMGIIGLIIFVGIPVVAAFVSVGMDAAELGRMEKLLDTLEDPSSSGRCSGYTCLGVRQACWAGP